MARILVIDDSEFVISSVRSALTPLGHQVETLASFLELVDTIRDNPPDLILLDIEMPLLPGKRAGEYIRKYARTPIPILIHSSRPKPELAELASSLKARGWVSKQEGPPALVRAVGRALG